MLSCLVSVEHIDPVGKSHPPNNDTRAQMKWYKNSKNKFNLADKSTRLDDYQHRYHITPTTEVENVANITSKANSIFYMTKLTIRSVERHDSGHFLCTAQNKYGFVQKNYSLFVLEVPDHPVDVRSDSVTSNSIKLRWKSSFDGNSPITESVISYRPLSSAISTTVSVPSNYYNEASSTSTSPKSTVYQLNDLIPFTAYSIQVKDKNSIGYSHFSEPVVIKTSEEREFVKKFIR